VVSIRLNLC